MVWISNAPRVQIPQTSILLMWNMWYKVPNKMYIGLGDMITWLDMKLMNIFNKVVNHINISTEN